MFIIKGGVNYMKEIFEKMNTIIKDFYETTDDFINKYKKKEEE